MFALKIHTSDSRGHLLTASNCATSAAGQWTGGPRPTQLKGVVHLFKHPTPLITRSTLLFISVLPKSVSQDDFNKFCGEAANGIVEMVFLTNDAMEDRHNVLIRLKDQFSADEFFFSHRGKNFKETEAEVCHICFVRSVDYSDSAEIASTPPDGYTVLPSCIVCLGRLNPNTSGIQSTLCHHAFHCSCVSKWTMFSCPVCQLCQQPNEKQACAVCGTFKNLWICLICGFVGCGRDESGHASGHWSDKHHHFSLDLEKEQISDEGLDRALFSSKNEGRNQELTRENLDLENKFKDIEEREKSHLKLKNGQILDLIKDLKNHDECHHGLLNGMKKQRQQYKTLLAEAKSGKKSSTRRAVVEAISFKTRQLKEVGKKYKEEKEAAKDMNQELTREFSDLVKKLLETEKSEAKKKDYYLQQMLIVRRSRRGA